MKIAKNELSDLLLGKAGKTDLRKGLNLCAEDCLIKPFEESEWLLDAMERISYGKVIE